MAGIHFILVMLIRIDLFKWQGWFIDEHCHLQFCVYILPRIPC